MTFGPMPFTPKKSLHSVATFAIPTVLALLMPAGAAEVTVSTLDGREFGGELRSLSSRTVVVVEKDEEIGEPVANVLEIAFAGDDGKSSADVDLTRVVLVDGSAFDATKVVVTKGKASIETARFGAIEAPLSSVRSIRFPGADPRLFGETWTTLAEGDTKSDLLVVRKPTVLDHLKGILGEVDTEQVRFSIGGNEIPVKLAKLYGIVYGNRIPATSNVVCKARLAGADSLALAALSLDGDTYLGRLASGATVEIPAETIRLLDYSIGKIQFLSRMEPVSVDYTGYVETENGGIDPFELDTIRYQRDQCLWTFDDDRAIKIGGKRYTRGLTLHSKTVIRYRLAAGYRTFKAVMGYEKWGTQTTNSYNLRLVVKGDDKVLLDTPVTNGDKPRELDLPVSGVNFLEITVDFGEDGLPTMDHLGLGDARLLK